MFKQQNFSTLTTNSTDTKYPVLLLNLLIQTSFTDLVYQQRKIIYILPSHISNIHEFHRLKCDDFVHSSISGHFQLRAANSQSIFWCISKVKISVSICVFTFLLIFCSICTVMQTNRDRKMSSKSKGWICACKWSIVSRQTCYSERCDLQSGYWTAVVLRLHYAPREFSHIITRGQQVFQGLFWVHRLDCAGCDTFTTYISFCRDTLILVRTVCCFPKNKPWTLKKSFTRNADIQVSDKEGIFNTNWKGDRCGQRWSIKEKQRVNREHQGSLTEEQPSMSANPVNSTCFIAGLMGCHTGMPAVL